ncbi:MAG: hypothetical protein AAGI34_10425 [Pseudomonadota bacterium]
MPALVLFGPLVFAIATAQPSFDRIALAKNARGDRAALYEINFDATTPFSYRLYLIPQGGPLPEKTRDDPVLLFTYPEEISLRWLSDDVVEVCIPEARIYHVSPTQRNIRLVVGDPARCRSHAGDWPHGDILRLRTTF